MRTYINARSMILIIVLVVVAGFAPPNQAAHAAGPWYVAPGGMDSNACTSPGIACATINGALAKASSGDMIYVASGTYTGSGNEVVRLDKNITLSGGWETSFTTPSGTTIIDGQDARRGIEVNENVTAVVERFTIQFGRADSAAGISNYGNLTLNECTISDNIDIGDETSEGGGIRNGQHGTLTLHNSTVSNNESSSGAGVFNAWGTIIINNSTISGNTARGVGGGINVLGGSAYINNTTISSNMDNNVAGGIHNEMYATVYFKNSILARNNSDGPDCNGDEIISSGYNLIGSTTGCIYTPNVGDLLYVDPLLGSLQDNSGPTFTQALLFGSPAINAGNPDGCKDHLDNPLDFDQRGFPRVQRCDIGAYEFQTEINKLFLPILVKPIYHSDDFNDNYLDTEFWTKFEGAIGVSIEETGKEIKVSGTSRDTSMGWSGLRTPSFPKGSFQTSVEYKLVNMTHDQQSASLRLLFDNGAHYFAIGYWDPNDSYFAGYKDNSGNHHLASLPAFGDEGKAFHTFKIVFDASTNTAKGYVDNILFSVFTSNIFTSPMHIGLIQSSGITGSFNVDCRFDNFSITATQ